MLSFVYLLTVLSCGASANLLPTTALPIPAPERQQQEPKPSPTEQKPSDTPQQQPTAAPPARLPSPRRCHRRSLPTSHGGSSPMMT
jgi:hypothetical protein